MNLNKADFQTVLGQARELVKDQLALTEQVKGLTIRGTKYEVENATLCKPTTLGQSNAFVTDVALAFESGVLAMICCRLEG